MKFKSPVYSQAARSIAGLTYSHNRGGMYTRARAIPNNPNTPLQQDVKAIMAQLSTRWVQLLSNDQRQAWQLYATNVQLPDVLGEMRNVGGLGMYNRSNLPRVQFGESIIDVAPTNYDLGTFTPFSVANAAPDFEFTFDDTDDWAKTDKGLGLIYASQQQNPTINYYKGPFRLLGAIVGDTSTPPTSPAVLSPTIPPAVGNKVFFQYRVSQPDGRLSLPVILELVIA